MPPTKRPKGVWAIVIFYSVSVTWTLLSFWLIYSERVPVPDATADYLKNPGALTRIMTVTGLVLTAGFVVTLFMLRRVAKTIFEINLALTAISYLWNILFTNYLSLLTVASIIGLVITAVVLAAIYFYLRVLVLEGKLT